MGAVFVLILFAIAMSSWGAIIPVGGGMAGLSFLIRAAIRLQQVPMRRGWAIGIWIGLGLAGLLEGICFGSAAMR